MIAKGLLRFLTLAATMGCGQLIWPARVWAAEVLASDEIVSFEQHVRPILKAYCFDCHGGGETLEGGLDLRLRRLAVKGGESGPALVPGDAAASLMVARLKAGEMPPGEKKLGVDQVAVIERWIASGAATRRDEPQELPPGIDITPEERDFWSFQPIRRIVPPRLADVVQHESSLAAHSDADIVRTPVDSFVLATLREHGLRFAPDADRLTFLRRAAFDLTGLPPSPAEIDEFLADTDPQAFERVLDKLLQSPHYGERWGRHWLDVVGYADSEGNGNDDSPRPFAHHYRDYVIRSFNADKPFDQFIVEQLAGDELVPPPWNNLTSEQIEKLAATGFLRMAADPTATGGGDEAANANQVVADTVKIVSSSLLGLTVGCAQCHDHRYDPIPQSDYYRLRAVFEPALDPAHWRRPGQRLVSLYTDADRAQAAAVDAEVAKLQAEFNTKQTSYVARAFEKELLKFPEEIRGKLSEAYNSPADKRTEEQKQLLASNPKANISPGVLYQYDQAAADELKADQAKIAARQAEKPPEDFIGVLNETPGTLPPTHVFHRGDYRQPTKPVAPGDLTIAAPEGQRLEIAEKDPGVPTSGRRLAFAKHLTSGRHPLVGRVLANRLWLHHFGRGLVETPGDFGTLGVRPTHRDLLDWLAGELVTQGWSLKRMHKLIMLSTVYRQSSVARHDSGPQAVDARALDANDAWYWHFPVRRLEAEILRDRMLVASGLLDRRLYGSAVPIAEDFVGQVVVADDVPRRGVYLQARRTKPVSFLQTFDSPVMTLNCERRVPSTGAPQSLMLMNSEFVLKLANLFALRLRSETPLDYAKSQAQFIAARFPRQTEVWQFGFGAFDSATGRMAQFTPLPHFTGSAWQGGASLPDPATGWAILHAAGGHAGNDPSHAAVRRWIAPRDGIAAIAGKLKHPSANGDGVRGRIVCSRTGLAGEWPVKTNEAATGVAALAVEAGDTLDFAVDCLGDVTSDSFEWTVEIKLADAQGTILRSWNSAADFDGPLGTNLPQQIAYGWQLAYQRPPTIEEWELACRFIGDQVSHLRATGDTSDHELTALTSLCQQLLCSNELLYVD